MWPLKKPSGMLSPLCLGLPRLRLVSGDGFSIIFTLAVIHDGKEKFSIKNGVFSGKFIRFIRWWWIHVNYRIPIACWLLEGQFLESEVLLFIWKNVCLLKNIFSQDQKWGDQKTCQIWLQKFRYHALKDEFLAGKVKLGQGWSSWETSPGW